MKEPSEALTIIGGALIGYQLGAHAVGEVATYDY